MSLKLYENYLLPAMILFTTLVCSKSRLLCTRVMMVLIKYIGWLYRGCDAAMTSEKHEIVINSEKNRKSVKICIIYTIKKRVNLVEKIVCRKIDINLLRIARRTCKMISVRSVLWYHCVNLLRANNKKILRKQKFTFSTFYFKIKFYVTHLYMSVVDTKIILN